MYTHTEANLHMGYADWTFVTPSSSSLSSWKETTTSSAGSTPRRYSSKLPSGMDQSFTLKRPRLQHRHTPEAKHLLSLVHAHEPIRVPVPPSLQGRRLSDRAVSQHHHQQPAAAWYDYNEFGVLEENGPAHQPFNGRSSPVQLTESRRSSSSSSISAPHHKIATAVGDAGIQVEPYGPPPPPPLLIPQQMHNVPPPLSLPSPIVGRD